MFCVKCGASLPDDANFCFKCGCDLRNMNQRSEIWHSSVSGVVKFGSYPQKNGNVKEPIEWLVLDVRGNEALLLSCYGLDCQPYHHETVDITWEDCDLRRWLNNIFFKAAFSEGEQQHIKLSEVVNDDNLEYVTQGGNSTRDYVFCLSFLQAERYFKNDYERQCWPSDYARNQGMLVDYTYSNGCCWWHLRSPGQNQNCASFVMMNGELDLRGHDIGGCDIAVRPALWVNL